MRILIEEYQYAYEDAANVLKGLGVLQDIGGKVSLSYVGYYFSPEVNDCVFILPKVLLEGEFGQEKVFGHIDPKDMIDADRCEELKPEEKKFIYELSVWVYRAICVFKDHEYDRMGGKKEVPSIVLHRQAPMMGNTRKRRKANTFLDVLLALLKWNKDNERYVMFIMKNLHCGYNKINWTRTISKSPAIVRQTVGSCRQDVSYLAPTNKKRAINFDEELLVIFFSILQHIHTEYGFPVKMNVNFELIGEKQIKRYIGGYGKRRLKQIRYKYFSDKAKELWELCYAFFDRPDNMALNIDRREYLLVKSFHVVFEAIIDELIGDKNLPTELKDQPDGKRVDHMYQYQELTNNDTDDTIYYIGDSKYYKRGNTLGKGSVYKQFTYARNVIQWNINLFSNGTAKEQQGHIKLRDDVTEGYNIIPNFFISAKQNTLDQKDEKPLIDADKPEGEHRQPYYLSRQFENRLFDRDTFLLAHYDVNFLFVVALYGRNNASKKEAWRNKVREWLRTQIQQMLTDNFDFYAITAHADVNPETYITDNFQGVLGKLFHPFENREGSDQQYYSLALRKPEKEKEYCQRVLGLSEAKAEEAMKRIADENEQVLFELEQAFHVAKCTLGCDPRTLEELPKVEPQTRVDVPEEFLTMHYLEKYPDDYILIGGYKGTEQLNWIFSRKGGKRDDAYNVSLGGKDVNGSVVKSRDYVKRAKFAILYDFEKRIQRLYTFRVKNTGEMSREKMVQTGYENPHHGRYFCYFFDEEITLGKFDINKVLEDVKVKEGTVDGQPIYLKGSELIKYRE